MGLLDSTKEAAYSAGQWAGEKAASVANYAKTNFPNATAAASNALNGAKNFATDTAYKTGKMLGSAASSVSGAASKVSGAVSGAVGSVKGAVSAGLDKTANFLGPEKFDSNVLNIVQADIGAPLHFNSTIDPEERTYNFLKSRMNVVDIFPCNYGLNLLSKEDTKDNGKKDTVDLSVFNGTIDYMSAAENYSFMCGAYGLPPVTGLRLYLTDDSVSSETVSTEYQDNAFQKFLNSLREMMSNVVNMGRSLNSEYYDNLVDKGVSAASSSLSGAASATENWIGQQFGDQYKDGFGAVLKGLKAGTKAVLKGNKLVLPKIWADSSYVQRFQLTTKLYSPYGTPEAIQEFIIKPMMYVLLMSLPRTQDGFSFNRPFAVSMRGYGLSEIPVACISEVSIRRGGGETAFNIYKQPLVMELSLNFDGLVEGLAAYDLYKQKDLTMPASEEMAYSDAGVPGANPSVSLTRSQISGLMPTLGTIVKSMSPVTLDGVESMCSAGSVRNNYLIGGGQSGGSGGGGLLGGLLGGVINAVGGVIDTVKSTVAGAIDSFAGAVSSAAGAIGGIFGAANEFSQAAMNGLSQGAMMLAQGQSLGSTAGAVCGSLVATAASSVVHSTDLEFLGNLAVGVVADVNQGASRANNGSLQFQQNMANQLRNAGSLLNNRSY